MDAVRCPNCGYVYWTRTYEDWGICDNCGHNNDRFFGDSEDVPLLVHSEEIFKIIPYDVEKWKHLNPWVKRYEYVDK